ncbi:MAG: hypothetical protein ACFHWX_02265 [Bacteroidota bacterium]
MKSKLLIIIGLQLAVISCNDQVKYEEIISDLILNISETFPNNGVSNPELTFEIETAEIYPCVNYQIALHTSLKDGHLRINILGTSIDGICYTALGPATSSFKLDERVERITISIDDKVDEYVMTIDESSVRVTPGTSAFSSFDFSTYFRYPKNSFAFLCGTLVEDSYVCDEFEQFLLGNLSLEKFEFPSEGKVPYPDSSEGHWYDAPAKYFKYKEADDLSKAGELLKAYYTSNLTNKEGLGMSILGWNNTHYRNDQRIN